MNIYIRFHCIIFQSGPTNWKTVKSLLLLAWLKMSTRKAIIINSVTDRSDFVFSSSQVIYLTTIPSRWCDDADSEKQWISCDSLSAKPFCGKYHLCLPTFSDKQRKCSRMNIYFVDNFVCWHESVWEWFSLSLCACERVHVGDSARSRLISSY